jgi:hypothetical protein
MYLNSNWIVMLFITQFHIGMNWCLSLQKHLKLIVFFNIFNFGVNKKKLLYVTH